VQHWRWTESQWLGGSGMDFGVLSLTAWAGAQQCYSQPCGHSVIAALVLYHVVVIGFGNGLPISWRPIWFQQALQFPAPYHIDVSSRSVPPVCILLRTTWQCRPTPFRPRSYARLGWRVRIAKPLDCAAVSHLPCAAVICSFEPVLLMQACSVLLLASAVIVS